MTIKNCEYTYFYIHDHLGSTSMVLDVDGNISQSVTYIPYGEIFVEERNGSWNSPYLFNSKELDEETGLYYYGARYLNPTSAVWMSVDPLWEKNIDASPYSYCHGNPVKMIDPDGMDEIYYREDGTEISRIKCKEDVKYVLRTQQTTGQMYRESSPTEKGNSNHIHPGDANIAENLITDICSGKRNRFFTKEEVQNKYFVKAPNQAEFDAAMNFIEDDGTGGRTDNNNCEYSFNLLVNEVRIGNKYVNKGYKTEQTFIGEVRDASKSRSVSTAYRDNHTHPSGVGSKGHKWQQAPSATDISNSSYRIRRVWGMGNETIYMFNNKGVQATIPYSIYRR